MRMNDIFGPRSTLTVPRGIEAPIDIIRMENNKKNIVFERERLIKKVCELELNYIFGPRSTLTVPAR